MSPSAYITKRQTEKSGVRFVVRYRTGGRYTPLLHAGSFRTAKDARERRDFVIAELAAGRDPRLALAQLARPARPRTLRAAWAAFVSSRVDLTASSRANYRGAGRRFERTLGDRDPASITVDDLQEWVAENAGLSAGTVSTSIRTLAQVLDHADVDPNPARSRKLRLPRVETVEPVPMTRAELHAILEALPKRWRLPVRLLEATGMRVGELGKLTWGDIDFRGSRLRVSRARTKTRSGQRFVQVPGPLMEAIDALLPMEDRTPERRVFVGATRQVLGQAISRACRTAGIRHFHPHDLRHRRASLWHAQGLSSRELSERIGHSKPSLSLDVYSHVISPEDDEWAAPPSGREVPVRSGEEG